jgi:hypothetical protein
MVEAVAAAACDGWFCRQRAAACLPVVPDFHRIQNRETDNLESPLQELCNAGVCPGVQNDVGHDVVSLEVIERDDHPPGRSRGVERVDGVDGLSIAGVVGDVGTVGGCAGEGRLAFNFGVGG